MKYTKLGKSDLTVSRICMGCMGFGDPEKGMHKWILPYDETKEIICYGLNKGINFFDTAMAYQSGSSEEFVGRALRESVSRNQIVIATKYTPRNASQLDEISGKEWIHRCIENSLKRLGTDYIDLYIMHSWDYHTPLDESMEALNEAYTEGKIRAIGVSNCYAWQVAQANALAEKRGWQKFVSVQGHYNLIFREEEREMAQFCYSNSVAMTPYSSLAAGRLARKLGSEESTRLKLDQYAHFKYDATADEDAAIIARVAELAEKHDCTMTEISLGWLLSKVTSPVVGATKPGQIDGAVKALDIVLTEEEIKFLEELYVPHPLVGVMATNASTIEINNVWEKIGTEPM